MSFVTYMLGCAGTALVLMLSMMFTYDAERPALAMFVAAVITILVMALVYVVVSMFGGVQ